MKPVPYKLLAQVVRNIAIHRCPEHTSCPDQLLQQLAMGSGLSKGTFLAHLLSGTSLALDVGKTATDAVTSMSKITPIPGLSAALGGLQILINTIQATQDNKQKRKDILNRIGTLAEILKLAIGQVERTHKTELHERLVTRIKALHELVEKLGTKSLQLKSQNIATQIIFNRMNASILVDINNGIKDAIDIFNLQALMEIERQINDKNDRQICDTEQQILDTLCQIEVGYKSTLNRVNNGVADGTRVKLLEDIWSWAKSSDLDKWSFIVSGGAGTGKSTIAYTVAEKLEKNGMLGASFFFARDSKDVSDTKHLVSSLARQVASYHPHIRPKIAEAIRRRRASSGVTLFDEFHQLILEPLASLPPNSPTIFFVIDALDECLDQINSNNLFDIVAMELKGRSLPLKIFLTGRPNAHSSFTKRSHCILHDLNQAELKADISTYLNERFSDISKMELVGRSNWYTPRDISNLTEQCHGLFIYASTSALYIKNRLDFSKPEESLKKVLTPKRLGINGPQESLNRLYFDILADAFGPKTNISQKEHDQFIQRRIRPALASISVLFQPLSVPSLAQILKHMENSQVKDADDVRRALKRLAAVILIPEDNERPLRTLHASFPEFLTDRKRCQAVHKGEPWFFVDSEESHSHLAFACLDILIDQLQQNILNISDPGLLNSEIPNLDSLITQHIPLHLQYACLHGFSHVIAVQAPSLLLLRKLSTFVNIKLLEYIEVLSLLGRTEVALRTLSEVWAWAKKSELNTDFQEMTSLLYDGYRFGLQFFDIISISAGQIHLSALSFTPDCILRKEYLKKGTCAASMIRGRDAVWNGNPWDCWPGSISPVGSTVIPGSSNNAIELRNSATGKLLKVLQGHSDCITSVSLAPDNSVIASGSKDKTIRVWDVATGDTLMVLEGHLDCIRCVSFSPNGFTIASGSEDNTVRVWDALTGDTLWIFKVYTEVISFVAFIPDGSTLISGSSNSTIEGWDLVTGDTLKVLDHSDSALISSISLSSDDSTIHAGTEDSSTHVIDLSTKNVLKILQGQLDRVASISFSLDGSIIAAGSHDNAIGLWHLRAGETLNALNSKGDIDVLFSSDGSNLVSYGSSTTRVSEMAIKGSPKILRDHLGSIISVTFSPDGSSFASASADKTIRVWDSKNGTILKVLKGHLGWVNCIAFSPDSCIIASGSRDKTVRLWNAKTGETLKVLQGHSRDITSIMFSPDGSTIASTSSDSTIRIWNSTNGSILNVLEGHSNWVRCVSFSPDGRIVVSGSRDKTIRVWDVANGKTLKILQSRSSSHVVSVSFSPDGSTIASALQDKTIRVWDLNTGKMLQKLPMHSLVRSVSFSGDGTKIIARSNAGTTVWNSRTIELTDSASTTSSGNPVIFFFSLSFDELSGLLSIYDSHRRRVMTISNSFISLYERSSDGLSRDALYYKAYVSEDGDRLVLFDIHGKLYIFSSPPVL
ncbi:hypothetical protein M422DRAFT_777108 [Sphaerobolus stellatus SS14]|nr:hypothetical protein M422DRAFT_777108 [Sphaerobolus stellatus SS14]